MGFQFNFRKSDIPKFWRLCSTMCFQKQDRNLPVPAKQPDKNKHWATPTQEPVPTQLVQQTVKILWNVDYTHQKGANQCTLCFIHTLISRAHDHRQATSAGMPSRTKNPTPPRASHLSISYTNSNTKFRNKKSQRDMMENRCCVFQLKQAKTDPLKVLKHHRRNT